MSLAADFLQTRYEKVKCLHRTAKGEVWLASDASGRLVIWKTIKLTGLPYAELKQLAHPLWPKVLYALEADGRTIVVEEFVQGEPLSSYIQQEKYLSEAEVKALLLQLCAGLSVLHAHGILHRDIKPSNLLVQQAGTSLELRLIDFDAARTVKAQQREDTHLLGTKGYAPPEQYGYEQTDARSDIYALGKTFLEVLQPDYQGYLREILQKCTEVDPKQRYASVKALQCAILHGKRNRRLKRIGKALLVGVVIAGAWTLYREWQAKPVVPATVQEVVKEETQKIKKPAEEAEKKIISIWQPQENSKKEQPAVTPTASAPATAEVTTTATTKEKTEPEVATEDKKSSNSIHVAYAFQGQRLNTWMDNWPDTVFDNGTGMIEVPRSTWQNWTHYPADYVAQVTLTNQSEEVFATPYLIVRYSAFGKAERPQILYGVSLQPGGSYTFNVPMQQFAVTQAADQSGARRLTLEVKGSGSQKILTPKFAIDFQFLSNDDVGGLERAMRKFERK